MGFLFIFCYVNSAIQIVDEINSHNVNTEGFISYAGWYKFAEINIASDSQAQNNYSNICEYKIGRAYFDTNNEAYHISEVSTFGKSAYAVINKSVNTRLITKIRQVYYPDIRKKYYELYYGSSAYNKVYVSFTSYPFKINKMDFELDNGNPTVISEYTIPA